MTSNVVVHFATNRNRTGDAAMFGSGFADPNNPDVVIYGSVNVAYDKSSGTWRPSGLQIDPAAAPTVALAQGAAVSAQASGSTPAAIARFVGAASGPRTMGEPLSSNPATMAPGLVFVHGFNTTFLDAVKGAAQLSAQHQIANVFVFSFPSLGNVALYALDAENAGKSHAALASVIKHLFAALQPHAHQGLRLELLCHSMGNFVLSGAFRLMTSAHPLLSTTYFRHAIHAAADVYALAFSQPEGLAQIINLAEEVEVYTNNWDKALAASFVLHVLEGDPDRLGAVGPEDFSSLPDRVKWIDCSQVAGNPLVDLGHGYYASAPAVIADLHQVLEGKAAGSIQPRETVGAANHFLIPVDDHTIALLKLGRGNSTVSHA